MKNPKRKMSLSRADVEKQRRMLEDLQPETELGKELVRLAIEGLESGVPRLTPEEISEYLGRNR